MTWQLIVSKTGLVIGNIDAVSDLIGHVNSILFLFIFINEILCSIMSTQSFSDPSIR